MSTPFISRSFTDGARLPRSYKKMLNQTLEKTSETTSQKNATERSALGGVQTECGHPGAINFLWTKFLVCFKVAPAVARDELRNGRTSDAYLT